MCINYYSLSVPQFTVVVVVCCICACKYTSEWGCACMRKSVHCVCIVTAFVLVSASFMHTLITTDACRDGCQARGYGNVRVDK